MTAANCPNCGSVAGAGEYCSVCGQRNRHLQLHARDLVSDSFDQIIEWRLPWPRTVIDLCWRPGNLALDYVRGRRAHYVNPVKYCFVVVAIAMVIGSFIKGGIVEPYRGQVVYADLPANLLALLAVPIQVAVLRLTFLSGSRTMTEIAVLCLYVTAQFVLLGQVSRLIAPDLGPLAYALIGVQAAIGVAGVKDFFQSGIIYAIAATIIAGGVSTVFVFRVQSFLQTGVISL